ncbi:MAG: hypothetical protein SAJ37_17320 [Oscillatoria sp. PMC 1068.18]|nr:hypothetical protein [Oscillatoria sp. PMC 1076.18]MEC4990494.1 hypothetical protein [Oscillatoria sp. PMC 1068.18]
MITITEFPASAKTSEPLILKGTATNIDDGDEILILVDKRFKVARPRIQDGKRETTLIFNQASIRLEQIR